MKSINLILLTFIVSCSQIPTLTTNKAISEVKVNNSLGATKDTKPINKPDFKVVKPVDVGNRNAYISLFLKDEFKIRLEGLDSISFKSLTNKDITKLNNLLVKYNTKKLEPHEQFYLKSEEELEIEEKASEKYYGVEYPNKGSIYTLYVENTDVKAFIEELRKNEYVLSANENIG